MLPEPTALARSSSISTPILCATSLSILAIACKWVKVLGPDRPDRLQFPATAIRRSDTQGTRNQRPMNSQTSNITSVLNETRKFPPPADFAAKAHIKTSADYEKLWTQ